MQVSHWLEDFDPTIDHNKHIGNKREVCPGDNKNSFISQFVRDNSITSRSHMHICSLHMCLCLYEDVKSQGNYQMQYKKPLK